MRIPIIAISLLMTSLLIGQTDPELAFINIRDGLTGADFSEPVDITGSGEGSDRLFVVEKTGLIKVIDRSTGVIQPTPYLDLSGQILTNSERGVLGIAFHPDFASNGYFYLNYISDGTGIPSSGQTVVSRFQASPANAATVDVLTEKVLLTITQPAANHNAGDLAFRPEPGKNYLYIPTGDGGGGGDPNDTGQNPQSLLGKMLRIDVDVPAGNPARYLIPADNPFVGDANVLDEIWAVGLRNPWRISFDRQTGDLWIGDVGQIKREEINFEPAGAAGGINYGWDCREGLLEYDVDNNDPGTPSPLCNSTTTYQDPIFDITRSFARSITGGFVYRGTQAADLVGHYVFADFATDRFFIITPPEMGGSRRLLTPPVTSGHPIGVSAFGEDDDGNLYVLNYFNGKVSRVTTVAELPVSLVNWRAQVQEKNVLLSWETASEENSADFQLERSADGQSFSLLTTITALGNSRVTRDYSYVDEDPLPGQSYYRLRQRDQDGAEEVFAVRSVTFRNGEVAAPVLSPNPANQAFFVDLQEVQVAGPVGIAVYGADGRKVYERLRMVEAGRQRLEHRLPDLAAGLYRVTIEVNGETFVKSLVVNQ